MEKGLEKLYTGDFNIMSQELKPDGSIVITLSKNKEKETYRFRVKNLYQENEEILEHEIIDTGPPKFIQERRRIADRQRGKATQSQSDV